MKQQKTILDNCKCVILVLKRLGVINLEDMILASAVLTVKHALLLTVSQLVITVTTLNFVVVMFVLWKARNVKNVLS